MKMSNGEYRRLHPLAIGLSSLKLIKEMMFPLIILVLTSLFRGGGIQDPSFKWRMGIGAIFFVFVVVWGILTWLRYSYTIIDGELRINHGVFIRTKQSISQERIQTIDLTEGILHRLFGVVKVQIETAGGSKPEAILTAVTLQETNWIKENLAKSKSMNLENQHEQVKSGAGSIVGEGPQCRLSFKHLLLSGATSGTISVTFAFLFAAIFQLEQILPEFKLLEFISGFFIKGVIPAIFIIVFMVSWLAAIGGTILKFYNFTLTRSGEELHITRGLLEKRQLTIPLARIQAIRIVEGIIRGKLGYVTVHVESAGYGTKKGDTTLLFPILPRKNLQWFLNDYIPQYNRFEQAEFQPLPKKAIWGYLIRPLLPVILIIVPLTVFAPYGVLSLILLPIILLYGFWKYKSTGWAVEQQALLLKIRNLGLTTVMIPRARIQWSEGLQSPFQLHSGLSSFSAAVASGSQFRIVGLELQTNLHLLEWFDRAKTK